MPIGDSDAHLFHLIVQDGGCFFIKISFYVGEDRCDGMIVEEGAVRGHDPVESFPIYFYLALQAIEQDFYETIVVTGDPVGADEGRIAIVVALAVALVTADTVGPIEDVAGHFAALAHVILCVIGGLYIRAGSRERSH